MQGGREGGEDRSKGRREVRKEQLRRTTTGLRIMIKRIRVTDQRG